MWRAAIRRHLQRWQPTPPPSHLCHVNTPSCPSKLRPPDERLVPPTVTSATPQLRGDDQLGHGLVGFFLRETPRRVGGGGNVCPDSTLWSRTRHRLPLFLASFHPSGQHE